MKRKVTGRRWEEKRKARKLLVVSSMTFALGALFGAAVVLLAVVVVATGFPAYNSDVYSVQPEQIHISYAPQPDGMVITWVTMDPSNDTLVQYGSSELSSTAGGNMSKFVDGGLLHRALYMHRVTLTNLKPTLKYYYRCGGAMGWSSLYNFIAMNESIAWSPRLAVFGDMGNANPQSLGRLQTEAQMGSIDAILHVGDFAYNLDTREAAVGDEFMRQIETAAAYVPYMTVPGNHEQKYNFSNYRNRFSMPGGDGEGIFYSFNMGPAHIVGISTEVYFFGEYGPEREITQHNWLINDLKEANLAKNRAQRPWIILMGHRPMYCSNNELNECRLIKGKVRAGLEDLLYEQGVDLQIWAHEHSYERLWPVYDRKVCNGSAGSPYTNPPAPVHITTGSAGCKEKNDHFRLVTPPWSALRSSDYGYSRMKLHNASHIYWEQISDDQGGKVIDSLWIIKDTHGAGSFNCR